MTFGEVAGEYLEVAKKGFRGAKTSGNLQHLLTEHAKALSARPVASIGSGHIEMALREVWLQKPDVARRTMEAIFRVLKFARAKKLGVAHVGDMRDDVTHLMPKVAVLRRHHPALPYERIPDFVKQLRGRQKDALSASAVEFLLLTVGRASEVAGMRWDEVDLEDRVWTVPASRMKAARAHRVPLCGRAIELLERQREATGGDTGGWVWCGAKPGGTLAGDRSTFT
jgi:integrase